MVAIILAAAAAIGPRALPAGAAADGEVTILGGAPSSLDPAAQGDSTSAAVTAQLYESLTAFDPSLTLRPALAESWRIEEDGLRVVLTLRPGLSFSDGTPLTAEDVVRSWHRVIDPERPSPLASLMLDVEGVEARLSGSAGPDAVGFRAEGSDVVVDLVRPGGDFPAIVAGPTFAVVPPGADDPSDFDVDGFVGSGGYVLSRATDEELTLTANERYWAGMPRIGTVHLLTDIGGRSPVDQFTDGQLDYTPIGQADAAWIRYDRDLGPALREVPSLSLEYLGFDTSRPPFDDVRVRQAFGQAVDWTRIVQFSTPDAALPATSMVPPGIPGRSEESFLPVHDPDAARALLAEAGYPGGRGFPKVTYLTGGSAYAEGILADLERELGLRPRFRTTNFDELFARLPVDPPPMWSLGWVADYPGRKDFLGVLLRTGVTNNYSRWSSAAFDAAIDAAGSTTDPVDASAAYDEAEAIIQQEVPLVPLAYGTGWALSRDGLLGAGQNGLGIIRMAGLAWSE